MKLSIVPFLLIFPSLSYADTIVVGASPPGVVHLSEGESFFGAFNLGAPYDVVAGAVTFNFADDHDDSELTLDSHMVTQVGMYAWVHNVKSVFHDPLESASASFGDQSVSGSTGFFTSSGHYQSGYEHKGNLHFIDTWITHEGYTGSFTRSSGLSAASLADLSDGLLGFKVTATSGDLFFTGAQLTAYANNPVLAQLDNRNPVPEPGSLALLLLGLLGVSRKRAHSAS